MTLETEKADDGRAFDRQRRHREVHISKGGKVSTAAT